MSSQPHTLAARGYLRSLFDFSFSDFVTSRVIRILYVLITIVYSLGAFVLFVVLLANHSPADVFAALVIVPLGYLIYLTLARVGLEVLMVIFRVGDDVRELRELVAHLESRGTEPGATGH